MQLFWVVAKPRAEILVLWFDGRMRRLLFWVPPVAIALLIFWLSSRSTYPGGIELPYPWDKLAHASVFGALALALELTFRHLPKGMPLHRRHLLIFVLVSCFGASDEIHQRFVPGRDCDVLDWMADSMGAALGLALSCLTLVKGRWLLGLSWWKGHRERPDASRPLMLVADPHWGEELTGLREATLANPEADWLFLGDVFDVWVGLPGMETAAQRSFLWWVQERRAAGRWVGLWMGNREYFLDSIASRFDYLGEGAGGMLPAEGLAFEHGDLINGADWKYRAWNVISRSAFPWLLVKLLPAKSIQSLARKLEASMRTTNRRYKLAFPQEAFRDASAEQSDSIFITGHFHDHQEEGKAIALPWAHEGDFARWSDGKVEIIHHS